MTRLQVHTWIFDFQPRFGKLEPRVAVVEASEKELESHIIDAGGKVHAGDFQRLVLCWIDEFLIKSIGF